MTAKCDFCERPGVSELAERLLCDFHFDLKIDGAIPENLEEGLMRIDGFAEDGEPLLSLTPAGVAHVEELMRRKP